MPLTAKIRSRSKGGVSKPEPAAEYERRFALFVASTDEKQRQLETIFGLLGGLRRRNDFLDVGAGRGDLTGPVSERFKRTTAVEPNPWHVKHLRERFPGFRIFPEAFERLDLGRETFDLVLCSHVLYYVPEPQWPSFLDRLFLRVRAGGKLLVVLPSPAGAGADFFRHFTGATFGTVRLWSLMTEKFGPRNVRAHYEIATVRTDSLEDMTDIGLFLLVDERYRKKRVAIRHYFETRHRVDRGYSFRQESITVEISRPLARGAAR